MNKKQKIKELYKNPKTRLIAIALFGETKEKEDRGFIRELDIRNAIRNAHMGGIQGDYIGLNRIAKAIIEGINGDFPSLMKELQKYIKI